MICEHCKTQINDINEAMVEWIDDDISIKDVRVVHNKIFSPSGSCFNQNSYYRKDFQLDFILKDIQLKNKLGLL